MRCMNSAVYKVEWQHFFQVWWTGSETFMLNFFRVLCTKKYSNRYTFDGVSQKNYKVVTFYRASYALAVYAVAVCLSVCLSVSVSVASRCSTKMAKHRKRQTTPHDSPGTLVFRCQKSFRNSNGVTPNGGTKWRWGRVKSANFDK